MHFHLANGTLPRRRTSDNRRLTKSARRRWQNDRISCYHLLYSGQKQASRPSTWSKLSSTARLVFHRLYMSHDIGVGFACLANDARNKQLPAPNSIDDPFSCSWSLICVIASFFVGVRMNHHHGSSMTAWRLYPTLMTSLMGSLYRSGNRSMGCCLRLFLSVLLRRFVIQLSRPYLRCPRVQCRLCFDLCHMCMLLPATAMSISYWTAAFSHVIESQSRALTRHAPCDRLVDHQIGTADLIPLVAAGW
jgi:hypothetical protein